MNKPWKEDFNPFLECPLTGTLVTTGEVISIFRILETIDGPVLLYSDDQGKKGAALYTQVSVEDSARYRQLAFFCHVADIEWKRILELRGELSECGCVEAGALIISD